jgi:hypothetical protein
MTPDQHIAEAEHALEIAKGFTNGYSERATGDGGFQGPIGCATARPQGVVPTLLSVHQLGVYARRPHGKSQLDDLPKSEQRSIH